MDYNLSKNRYFLDWFINTASHLPVVETWPEGSCNISNKLGFLVAACLAFHLFKWHHLFIFSSHLWLFVSVNFLQNICDITLLKSFFHYCCIFECFILTLFLFLIVFFYLHVYFFSRINFYVLLTNLCLIRHTNHSLLIRSTFSWVGTHMIREQTHHRESSLLWQEPVIQAWFRIRLRKMFFSN